MDCALIEEIAAIEGAHWRLQGRRAVVARVLDRLGLPPAARALDRPQAGLAVVGVFALLTAAAFAAGPMRPGYEPAAHAASDLGLAEARAHTPRDALFLVPPTNTSFRTYTRRGGGVNFKPTPYQRGSIEVWLARVLTVAPMAVPETGRGFQEALDAAYATHAAEAWQPLAARFGADYALLDLRATPATPAGPPAFRSGGWALYRLTSPR